MDGHTAKHVVRRSHIATLLVILLGFVVGSGHLQAAPTARTGDAKQAQVSSDGVLPEATTQRRTRVSTSFQGTGELVDGGNQVVNDKPGIPASADGNGSAETVIGPDGRYRITTTTTFPYRAVGYVTFTQAGANYICSGWLISKDTVATAGHCVYDAGAWSTNVKFYPGRNGTSAPYGSCTSKRLYSVTGWVQNADPQYDYGAIKLNCTVGTNTGWFGFRWQSASLTNQPSYIMGYPGDKPAGTMWRSDDKVRLTETRRIYYDNDTYGGMSGAAVSNSYSSTCQYCGIAIHAYSVGSNGHNGGTRIVQEVFNNLVSWKNAL